MGQHQLAGHVADGVHAGGAGRHALIDGDEAARVKGHAGVLQPVAFRARLEADGLQQLLGLQDVLLAVRRRDADPDFAVSLLHAIDARPGHEPDAQALVSLLQFFGDLLVLQRGEMRQVFDQRHVHAVVVQDIGELQADCPRAGDDDAPG